MRNVSEKTFTENQNTILCSTTFFFFENSAFYEIMWKYRAGQATDDNMAHSHCMLDIYGYKYTLKMSLFHCINDRTNAPCCYVTRILPFLLEVNDFLSGIIRVSFVFKSVTRVTLVCDIPFPLKVSQKKVNLE